MHSRPCASAALPLASAARRLRAVNAAVPRSVPASGSVSRAPLYRKRICRFSLSSCSSLVIAAVCQFHAELRATAKKIATAGKGILAADESTGTIGSRFKDINLANTHENRMEYRRLLFTTPELEKYISGVILFEETLFDKDATNGQLLVKPLMDRGIVLGIKVDQGTKHLPGTDNETYTQVSR